MRLVNHGAMERAGAVRSGTVGLYLAWSYRAYYAPMLRARTPPSAAAPATAPAPVRVAP